MVSTYLQVELCRESSVFHVADVILGEVQVGQVSKATERRIMDGAYFVFVEPQVHNGAAERQREMVCKKEPIPQTSQEFLTC